MDDTFCAVLASQRGKHRPSVDAAMADGRQTLILAAGANRAGTIVQICMERQDCIEIARLA